MRICWVVPIRIETLINNEYQTTGELYVTLHVASRSLVKRVVYIPRDGQVTKGGKFAMTSEEDLSQVADLNPVYNEGSLTAMTGARN